MHNVVQTLGIVIELDYYMSQNKQASIVGHF